MKLSGRVQRLAGVATKPLAPARAARRSCRVTAVLQEDPKVATAADQLLRARLEQLLPPSTRDTQAASGLSDMAGNLRPRYVAEHKDAVWYLSYGANMCFDTLARRGVKVLQRAPCVLVDPNIKLVFQHRAGACCLRSAAACIGHCCSAMAAHPCLLGRSSAGLLFLNALSVCALLTLVQCQCMCISCSHFDLNADE
eukprot:GHRQ01021557.1.p1 GENE.GHRQ01021557.1~~GHRQ01021557.1.p1  ORF type:complete len:197 (+),score=3.67 GHRQ01021557.1:279-869(+)